MLENDLRNKIVSRLTVQYGEYVALQSAIDDLMQEKIIGGEDATLDQKIARLKKLQAQLSDEMTFATPLVWILYKTRAYMDTPQAIETLDDFRAHCSPEGYICTRRFNFMRAYLQERGVAIDAMDGMLSLEDFAQLPEIARLEADDVFMQHWQAQEYHREGGNIEKWLK